MAKITGLGGIFYKVADPQKTRAWYQDNLGIGGEWGAMFPFKDDDPEGFTLCRRSRRIATISPPAARTSWSICGSTTSTR